MKTADEMREQARKRLYKHREDMMARGYKSTTCFIHLDILAEFDRLRDNHGWTRHESLDHFFNCYLDSLKVKPEPEPVIDPDEFDFEIIEPETASTTDDIDFEQYRCKKVSGADLVAIADLVPLWSAGQISDKLNAIGATTQSTRNGGVWTAKKVRQNLTNAKKKTQGGK